MRLVPREPCARAADGGQEVPYSHADEDSLGSVNDERTVDRIELVDRDAAAGFKDRPPLGLRLLQKRSEV